MEEHIEDSEGGGGGNYRERRNVRNEDWFEEECRAAVAEKNRARQRMLQRVTRGKVRKYHQLRSKGKQSL